MNIIDIYEAAAAGAPLGHAHYSSRTLSKGEREGGADSECARAREETNMYKRRTTSGIMATESLTARARQMRSSQRRETLETPDAMSPPYTQCTYERNKI